MRLKNLLASVFLWGSIAAQAELWLCEQEFVRFGKKDAYEELKKSWNSAFASHFQGKGVMSPVLAIQDLESTNYVYLTPMHDYSGLDARESQLEAFEATLKNSLTASLASTMNFRIASLQTYLPECSHIPEGSNCSFSNNPFMHYQIFSLTPGSEALFEEHLKKLVFEEQMKKTELCWRVWKVNFGGDLPKYIVCRFEKTKDELNADKIKFIQQSLKEIVRSYREGKGVFRKDLSVIMPGNP